MSWSEKNGWQGPDNAPQEQAYLGNGLIGWRIGASPLSDDGRCYVAGFCEHVAVSGITQQAELPNPLALHIRMGRRLSSVTTDSQQLDYRTATLSTRLHLADEGGNSAKVTLRNVAFRNVPSLLGMRMQIQVSQEGPLTIALRPSAPRGSCRLVSSMASAPGALRTHGDVRISWQAELGGYNCGAAVIPVVDKNTPFPALRAKASGPAANTDTLELHWESVRPDQRFTIDWLAGIVSNLYHPQPTLQASRMAQWAAKVIGWDELYANHCDQWEAIWATRPIVDSDDNTQRAVDGAMYHLHSSAHRSSRQSMAPFGLSSNGYYGHVFWDCETWTFPPVLLQNPAAAKSILRFRLAGLEQARKHADLFGWDGAMFPWEANLEGAEDTPAHVDTGYMEHHITPDVAWAFWQYQCATGDERFLHEGTWPVLREVADWIVSRVEKTSRGWELRHVVPADEFSWNVNNSAHTNLACIAVLRAAASCAQAVGTRPDARWDEVSRGLFVPRGEDGMILQQEGWTPEHRSKQADTTLAIYPLGMIDQPEDIAQVVKGHVHIDPEMHCAVAMGDQVNAVVCARVNQAELAATVWSRGWKPYWIEPWGMYAETAHRRPGCFITGCGGLLQAVLMGFPGLQLDRKGFAYYPPAMPKGWKAIACERLWLDGRPHRLLAEPGMDKALLEPVN